MAHTTNRLYQFQMLSRYPRCLHGVTHKLEGQPLSCSVALHTGETEELVLQNREQIALHFTQQGATHFVVANQTHSDRIVVVEESKSYGWESQDGAIVDCDGLITVQKGVMLGILTADCVPVLLYDPQKEVAAAIHAGWRGSASKIVLKAVKKMEHALGSSPCDIVAGIAPAIGGCCYEVDKEVASHFCAYPTALQDLGGNKMMLDLPEVNRLQLIEAGVKAENIELSGICTACEVEHFFSYRKEQGCSGRFMSLIGVMS